MSVEYYSNDLFTRKQMKYLIIILLKILFLKYSSFSNASKTS